MKKIKLLKSFISVILSAIMMFSLFSFSVVHKAATADMSLNNRIKNIGNNISDFINRSDVEKEYKGVSGEKVYLGGYPIGLKLYADGVIIVGTEPVDTINGLVDTAKSAGVRIGDIIIKVNGERVSRTNEISERMEESMGKEMIFTVKRDGKEFEAVFRGAFSESEKKYKAGIWVRDSSAGIGTVTFCTQEGKYASLGHAVCDIDTKMTLPISNGECTDVNITGFRKGTDGIAGELCGYLKGETTGTVVINGNKGVYGVFNRIPESDMIEIASADEIREGEAVILTTLDGGGIKQYSIRIEKIDRYDKDNKHLVIKVTDPSLIEKTGGIIQGMSGSPIIQNGKLIGAVTHVFLNDSAGGFGILAETMTAVTQNFSFEAQDKAS